jgi:hypothetical protein
MALPLDECPDVEKLYPIPMGKLSRKKSPLAKAGFFDS